jgi:hypothetical protein
MNGEMCFDGPEKELRRIGKIKNRNHIGQRLDI